MISSQYVKLDVDVMLL